MQNYKDFLQLVERKQEALDLIELIKKMPTQYKTEIRQFNTTIGAYEVLQKTINIETPTDLIDTLKKETKEASSSNGISYMGGGYFSLVYAGSGAKTSGQTEYVLKHSRPGAQGETDRWQDFAALAQNNESNPLFPKVLYYREFDNDEMLAVIEYLTIDPGKASDIGVDKVHFRAVAEYVEALNRNPNHDFAKKQVHGYAKLLGINPEHLIDFLTKIKTLNAEVDIHGHNVGWRGDQLVIFDPVSWNAEYGITGK